MGQNVRVTRSNTSKNDPWYVDVVGYFYALELPDGPEIVAYQWDPDGSSNIKFPHLHIGRGATGNVTTFGPRGLHPIYFPTKHIALEDVLRLAIAEFGVEPRRTDWERILGDEQA